MKSRHVGSSIRVATFAIGVLGVAMAGTAAAQQAPRADVEFAAGWVGFADDGIVSETMVGGSARVYLLPRVAIGPEILHVQGPNHSHVVLTGNVTFDFLGPQNGRPPLVTPFVVAGVGLFRTRNDFPSGFTSNEGAFTAGGGVRALVGDRLIVGAEARIGWEPHLRVNGTIGWRFGNR